MKITESGTELVSVEDQVRASLMETLQITDADQLSADTELLGTLPEFDSMAVVGILTALEERFDILIDDDEISGEIFVTLGTLTRFVSEKIDG